MRDSEIVALFWRRDEKALTETEQAYGGRLDGLAFGLLRRREDAEECVSDTYWKTWETIPPQRPERLFAYLAKICRFLAFDRLDRAGAQKRSAQVVALTEELAECIPDRLAEREAESRELGELLDGFLAGLPREERTLFLRRYWYGGTTAELARQYRLTESGVKSRLRRTREKLRTYLNKEGIEV